MKNLDIVNERHKMRTIIYDEQILQPIMTGEIGEVNLPRLDMYGGYIGNRCNPCVNLPFQ